MTKRKHMVRRGIIVVLPMILAIVFSSNILMYIQINANEFYDVLKMKVGVWATLLGFIITAASILITFNGSKLTEEIKDTGHFKTVLFVYMLTCIELLISLTFFIGVLCFKIFSPVIVCIFVASVTISIIDVLLCLVFLSFVIYTIFK